jgi:hypothetical protein
MVTNKGVIDIVVTEAYLMRVINQMEPKVQSIEPFYDGLVKTGIIKIIKKGWAYNPEVYDFVFRIKPGVNIDTPEFSILTKATMVDLLKRRKIIQYIILKQTSDAAN